MKRKWKRTAVVGGTIGLIGALAAGGISYKAHNAKAAEMKRVQIMQAENHEKFYSTNYAVVPGVEMALRRNNQRLPPYFLRALSKRQLTELEGGAKTNSNFVKILNDVSSSVSSNSRALTNIGGFHYAKPLGMDQPALFRANLHIFYQAGKIPSPELKSDLQKQVKECEDIRVACIAILNLPTNQPLSSIRKLIPHSVERLIFSKYQIPPSERLLKAKEMVTESQIREAYFKGAISDADEYAKFWRSLPEDKRNYLLRFLGDTTFPSQLGAGN